MGPALIRDGSKRGQATPPDILFPIFYNNSVDPDITVFQITCVSDK